MVEHVHYETSFFWPKELHRADHRLVYKYSDDESFGAWRNPSPVGAYDDPATWAISAAWPSIWFFVVVIISLTGLAAATFSITCCARCCRCERRANERSRAQNVDVDTTTMADVKSAKREIGFISIWIWIMWCAAIALFIYYSVTIVHTLPRSGDDMIDIVDDIQDYFNSGIATVRALEGNVTASLALAVAWRDSGIFAFNQNASTEIGGIVETINATAVVAGDVVDQIAKDYDLSTYTAEGRDQIKTGVKYIAMFLGTWAFMFISVAGVSIYRNTTTAEKQGTVIQRGERDSCCLPYTPQRCCIGWITSVTLLLTLVVTIVALGSFALATMASDLCYEPYDYINIFAHGGNISATYDPDDVMTFYIQCSTPTGGPVNANIDDVYHQAEDARLRLVQLENVTNSNPFVPESARLISHDLIGNVSHVEVLVNATRDFVDCRKLHEFSERFLSMFCATILPSLANWTIISYAFVIAFFLTLLLLAIPDNNNNLNAPAENDESRKLISF